MAVQIQVRRGNSSQWVIDDPILAEGEIGLELDTNAFKIGNGVSNWTDLPYATGIQGVQGLQGNQGVQATIGQSAGFGYTFSNSTVSADPGSGFFRLNSGTVGSVTSIFISDFDYNNINRSTSLLEFDDTVSPQRAIINIPGDTPGTTLSFTVNGAITDNTTWLSIPVTGGTGSLPTNNERRSIFGVRYGIQGVQGLQGNQGTQGLQGLQGNQGTQGLQGLQGNQGTQGLQGRQGSQGSQGLQGLQGNQGLSNQGSQGLQGNQGNQGTQGNQGLQGLQGLQGSPGTATTTIPQNSQSTAYTLVATDASNHINTTVGIITVATTTNFRTGDAVTIFNNTTGVCTITSGAGITMRLAGTASTGNRTLATYGICNILCFSQNQYVIAGAGLT